MKRVISLLLMMCVLLCGCTSLKAQEPKQYTATFLTLFDTVTTIVGHAGNEDEFKEMAQKIHDDLEFYHRLFDIYNEYDGINNLKTVNDRAGIAPVQVDRAIIDLLLDCRQYYELTGGRVNAAMGSILELWHEARDQGVRDPANAALPDSLLLFYQNLGTFDLITIFGKVFRALDVCLPLYALLTMILVPVIYQEFRKKQVT